MSYKKDKLSGKLIILSSPSGGGKTTIMRHLIECFSELEFSVSATSRGARSYEGDGKDFYFISDDEFRRRVENGEFVEWEEVYSGTLYGTLHSELERIWRKGKVIVFDVDVKGGINLKKKFGDNALSLFIMPPSVEELRRRLISRDTDSMEFIEQRVAKAETEIADAGEFDRIVINDDLDRAKEETVEVVNKFLEG